MQLHNRQVLFPLLERLDRQAVRALGSTSKTLRAVCANICPGFWHNILFKDPTLTVYNADDMPSTEHACFLQYSAKYSPWRIRHQKWSCLALSNEEDFCISTDGKRVQNLNKLPDGLSELLMNGLTALTGNVRYLHIAMSPTNTVLLRSDRTFDISSFNNFGAKNVPELPAHLYCDYITMGSCHVLVLMSDGNLYSWGAGARQSPPLPAPGTTFVAVSSMGKFDLALQSDGNIVVWNCVNGNDAIMHVPELPAGLRYIQISAGGDHACALRNDGQIVTWGTFNYPGLANVPVLPVDTTYVQVRCGAGFSVALRSDGSLVGWGTEGRYPSHSPVDERLVEIACYRDGCMALSASGTVYSFHFVPYPQTTQRLVNTRV